jgi:hypothetical protein
VGTVNQVRVVIESDAGTRVAELPLHDLGSGACIKHGGGVHVPEGMLWPLRRIEDCTADFQRTKQNTASLLFSGREALLAAHQ